MKITSLKAVAVRVPVKRPTRISTRVLDKRDYVLVRIRREDADLEGVGYVYAGTSGGALVAEAVNAILAPLLLGRSADDIVGAWDAMYQETLLHGRRGAVMRAISAVDIGLWDLAAKRAGCSWVEARRRCRPTRRAATTSPTLAPGQMRSPGRSRRTSRVASPTTRSRSVASLWRRTPCG